MTDEQPRYPLLKNHWEREAHAHSVEKTYCNCMEGRKELFLHTNVQDTECQGWKQFLELIDEAAKDGREEFSPVREIAPEDWVNVITLPPSIAKLKAVKHFILYGSNLERIPPEIGEMESLEQFTPYTSYRLHWFPYEIRRCKKLRNSTVSTRALYGNYKFRTPFPKLPQISDVLTPKCCSICQEPFSESGPVQAWISLPVATDVLPLLVHACSKECLEKVPSPPKMQIEYIRRPHRGGLNLSQPKKEY